MVDHDIVAALALLAIALSGCTEGSDEPRPGPETVFSLQPSTWFEDGWSSYDVAPDGSAYLFGARFGRIRYDATTGQPDPEVLPDAFFGSDGRLWRRGVDAWVVTGADGSEDVPVPRDALPRFSRDRSRVAYFRGTAGSGPTVLVGTVDAPVEHDLGGRVTGLVWMPEGDAVVVSTFREDGVVELHRVDADGEEATLLRSGLDGLARFNTMAVSPGGGSVYLALVGPDPPDPEVRHRPRAGRDTDIYRIDLTSGDLEPVVTEPGDDFAPRIVGENLYWTHNEYRDAVAIVPVAGGDPREIVSEAQIPYWSADGSRIAFTVGGWMIADWALNMDAWVVDVDDVGDRLSDPRPLVTGYHEDFTPAWSPDGRWLAYHSHRSEGPVSHYFAAGGTDDIWLLRDGAPMSREIRLTDFGWEVGMADWDRTGTRLFFDSWERGGPAGVSQPWIATIDPETGQAISLDRLRVPTDFGGTVLAAWSPVADELAVVERIEGSRHALWLMRPDGSRARRLFEYEASTYGGVDWTPDGSTLVYGALSGHRMQLFAYSVETGVTNQLTRATDDIIHPQVSPDGQWVAASKLRHVKELRRRPAR